MKKSRYTRTDLACESVSSPPAGAESGLRYKECTDREVDIAELEVLDEAGERETGRARGTYITLSCGVIRYWDDTRTENVASVIAAQLRALARKITRKEMDRDFRVLVAGLGNRLITADAIGPETVELITVTRHVKTADRAIYDTIGACEVSSLAPGVVGQTGIETAELIRGATQYVHPDLLVVIDALAARSCQRLAATIQLSDAGIAPGSGIGNKRSAINRETIGVPVIAVGVPTVVDSSTLVYDALEQAGIEEIDQSLRDVLENGRSFFVSLKETDIITKEIAHLLALAINEAFVAE